MREPKKVPAYKKPRYEKSRRELIAAADQELWNKLHKLGMTSSSGQISSGSEIVDRRLRTQIGAPKGDPTLGQWHGKETGPIRYPGSMPIIMQYRRQVMRYIIPTNEVESVCLIWIDETVKVDQEDAIARAYEGDFLASLPLNTPFSELQRQLRREFDDPTCFNKE